jgi:hypothetical protein
MANHLRVPNTDTHITWRQGVTKDKNGEALDFVIRKPDGTPVAKAKLTAEQLHAYICMHNTMK